ncbi:MAG TPA: amino acid permease [Candidatus Polarisedimenticolaceae bacterium]|nr:amino acid permease [Candidatus Polarisedimenticolaceae bacterium]
MKPAGLEPKLSTFDATMIVVSLVIGIGIFRTPALVAAATGRPLVFFAAWIVGGAISAIGALTFAEIGARFPRPGAYYAVVADCYHSSLAFMLNWAGALMQGAGAAGVAFIGAEHLVPFVGPGGHGPRVVQLTAIALLLVLVGLNYLGIRTGARAQNLLSLLKIALILLLAGGAFLNAPAQAADPSTIASSDSAAGWSGLLGGLVAVFYTYGGYHNTINVGGDVRDARRSLPQAIVLGMLLVTALYLVINLAYVRVLGLPAVAASPLVAAEAARVCFGRAGHAVVSTAIFLSAMGFVNATILQVPRAYYAMAEDGVLPAAFLRVNPRTQVQELGLLCFAVTLLVPALLVGSFEKLLNYVMFTDALSLAVVASTLFVLRRRAPGAPASGWRVPGYPVLPALFVLLLAGVALRVLWTETVLALAGAAILLAGWPLFYGMRRLAQAR